MGLVAVVALHEVRRHVVGGPERRRQRELPARRQVGDLIEGSERVPEHHRRAGLVDPSATRPARQLRELSRREELVAFPVELAEPFDHDRLGRHVDADRQRLGREDDLEDAQVEALLDGLAERRDHAGMMRCDTRLERRQPAVVAEHVEVLVAERHGATLRDRADEGALLGGGQPHPGIEQASCGLVAAVPAEDEVDRREQPLGVEAFDGLEPAGRDEPGAASSAVGLSLPVLVGIEAVTLRIGPAVDQQRHQVVLLGAAVTDEHQRVEADRPLVLDDGLGGATERGDPLPQLHRVRHRRGQAHEPGVAGCVDQHLLPHRPAVRVLEEVDLVEHDPAQAPQRR